MPQLGQNHCIVNKLPECSRKKKQKHCDIQYHTIKKTHIAKPQPILLQCVAPWNAHLFPAKNDYKLS